MNEQDKACLSPLIHEHINTQGRHSFMMPEPVVKGNCAPCETRPMIRTKSYYCQRAGPCRKRNTLGAPLAILLWLTQVFRPFATQTPNNTHVVPHGCLCSALDSFLEITLLLSFWLLPAIRSGQTKKAYLLLEIRAGGNK